MKKFLRNTVFAGLITGVIFAAASAAAAQMTIFNIPTTDTLPRSSFFVEADLIMKPGKYEDGGFQTYGFRTVYGVDSKTEVGANFFYTRDGGDRVGELQLNAKRNLYTNEDRGVAVSAGVLAGIPLRDRRGAKPYALIYSNVSKKLEPINGLRVTGGVYHVVGGGDDFGTRTGAMVGVEQPIYKQLSFVGDWYSGKNRFGYTAVGLNLNLSKRSFVLAGYNFGNSGRGNNAFSAFWGYTF